MCADVSRNVELNQHPCWPCVLFQLTKNRWSLPSCYVAKMASIDDDKYAAVHTQHFDHFMFAPDALKIASVSIQVCELRHKE